MSQESNALECMNVFTIAEASELITGSNTNVAYRTLIKLMQAAFINTCGAHFEYFLNPIDEFGWWYEADEYGGETGSLPSAPLAALVMQAEPYSRYWNAVRNRALVYLDSAIDEVSSQTFHRFDIDLWLEERGIKSAYDFGEKLRSKEIAPVDRKAAIQRLLIENGGNKTIVGEILGISRQRVHQILVKGRPKDLAPKAKHPFGWN